MTLNHYIVYQEVNHAAELVQLYVMQKHPRTAALPEMTSLTEAITTLTNRNRSWKEWRWMKWMRTRKR